MREWIKANVEDFAMIAVIVFGLIGLILSAIWIICYCLGVGDLHSTWTESAEFSQLMTGQERFSEHATNVDGLVVVVDHETGVQYLVTAAGACPLLDVDGTLLLVLEAGS